MPFSSKAIGLILLAAGASTRMGKAKQLLDYQGESLLQRSAKAALEAELRARILVIGARREQIEAEAKDLPIPQVYNPDWETGMGSSVRTGLQKLLEDQPDLDAVLIMLCDQPFVNADLLNQMIAHFQASEFPILASAYEDTLGVPAIFARDFFEKLLNLGEKGGARKIIKQNLAEVQAFPFPQGAIDIDTPEDYEKLLRGKKNPKMPPSSL